MKGTVTVVLAVLLAMAIVFPGGGVAVFAAAEEGPFPDVPESHWASSYIDDVRGIGILQGFPDGTFRPGKSVTYGEFLKMTVLSLGEGKAFGDFSAESHWALPYYEKGLSEGWFSEREIPQAYLDRAIPREHMALILCGTLDSSGIFSFGGPLKGITDIHAGNPYAFEISAAYSEGLLTGYPDGSFRPKGSLTRAEAAAVVWRLLEKMKASEVPAEDAFDAAQGEESFTEIDEALGYFRQDFPEGDQYVKNDPADPAGTLRIVYDGLGSDPSAQLVRIEKTLKEELGAQGEEVWEAFLDWKAETLDAGRSDFREYTIGNRQVLLDTLGGKIYIFLEVTQ